MAKARTFMRNFGSENPNRQTFFVEKILNSLNIDYTSQHYYDNLIELNQQKIRERKLSEEEIKLFHQSLNYSIEGTKIHTIRDGFHFKSGDYFSPRIWTGKPYNSVQIVFHEDLQIMSTQTFAVNDNKDWIVDGKILSTKACFKIAAADGLNYIDMRSWFKNPMIGQVIAWGNNCIY